jgi:hypothetical protein
MWTMAYRLWGIKTMSKQAMAHIVFEMLSACVCVCITSSRLFTANSQFFQEHEGGWVPL